MKNNKTMEIANLFEKTIEQNASDLHLLAGSPPILRVDGVLTPIPQTQPIQADELLKLVLSLLTEEQKEAYLTNKSLDFSYGYGGGNYGDKGRFRINIYFQKGSAALAARLLPPNVKTIDECVTPFLRVPNVEVLGVI